MITPAHNNIWKPSDQQLTSKSIADTSSSFVPRPSTSSSFITLETTTGDIKNTNSSTQAYYPSYNRGHAFAADYTEQGESRQDSSPLTLSPINLPNLFENEYTMTGDVHTMNHFKKKALTTNLPPLPQSHFMTAPRSHLNSQNAYTYNMSDQGSFNLKPRSYSYQSRTADSSSGGAQQTHLQPVMGNWAQVTTNYQPSHHHNPPHPHLHHPNNPYSRSPNTQTFTSSNPISNRPHHHAPHHTSTPHTSPGTTSTPGVGGHSSSNNTLRSSPEILKTLLRKKACLYEPITSRAIALITWLVGRDLAYTHGYFTRQHLQSGVHAVVAQKIDCGIITRTKVNRCMQIILNSCFHYIIPRPDGVEENGDSFRERFTSEVSVDDSFLMETLSAPWDDLVIDPQVLKQASDHEHPQESQHDDSEDHHDKGSGAAKRVVLICFNDNVRSAEDVIRCHNEFIRDAAIAANLSLSAEEWRLFFSFRDDDGSHITEVTADSSVSLRTFSSPIKNVPQGGCDIPYLSFDFPKSIVSPGDRTTGTKEPWSHVSDIYGQMNFTELSMFRTTWCCKRYEHDPNMCIFAHVDVNKGWLRRNPQVFCYSDQMCPSVTIVHNEKSMLNGCYLNACKDGRLCKLAHSQEEIDYHPNHYKCRPCNPTVTGGTTTSQHQHTHHPHVCQLLDICPNSHPENRFSTPKSSSHHHSNVNKRHHDSSSSRGQKGHGPNTPAGGKHTSSSQTGGDQNTFPNQGSNTIPRGSPALYLSPSPESDFDALFQFPGLSQLYRRNCATHYAYDVVGGGGSSSEVMEYSNFKNDWNSPVGPFGGDDESWNNDKKKNRGFSLYSSI